MERASERERKRGRGDRREMRAKRGRERGVYFLQENNIYIERERNFDI